MRDRYRTRLLLATLLATLLSACGPNGNGPTDGPNPDDTDTPEQEGDDVLDFAGSRHGALEIVDGQGPAFGIDSSSAGAFELPGSGGTIAAFAPATIVLNNCDDDDGDGNADNRNEKIDSEKDLDDLAHLVLKPLDGAAAKSLKLVLVAPSQVDQIPEKHFRLFIGKTARLGGSLGATHTLSPAEKEKLEAEGLHLFVEALTFQGRASLELREHDTVLTGTLLSTAPLRLVDTLRTPQQVTICFDPANDQVTHLFDAVKDACEASGMTEEAWDPIPVAVSDEGNRDWWVQDELQWACTKAPWQEVPMQVAVHLPRGRALQTWARSQLGKDIGYVEVTELPKSWEERSHLSYGGNVEASPPYQSRAHGVCCAGVPKGERNLPAPSASNLAAVKAFLERSSPQPFAALATWWLAIGHVDEVFAFVARPDATPPYALLVASPQRGINLLKDLESVAVQAPFKTRYANLVPAEKQDGYAWGDVLMSDVTRGQASLLLDYNERLDGIVFGSPEEDRRGGILGVLLAALGDDAKAIPVIEVPAFFFQGDTTEHLAARALIPNMVNLVGIGSGVLVPDPHLKVFKEALELDLEGTTQDPKGTTIHWIDAFDYLHVRNGGVHCATNVRYEPR